MHLPLQATGLVAAKAIRVNIIRGKDLRTETVAPTGRMLRHDFYRHYGGTVARFLQFESSNSGEI